MRTHRILLLAIVSSLLSLGACKQTEKVEQMRYLSAPGAYIYPDYTDCTIPVNIAPLNFYILPEHRGFELTACGKGETTLQLKGRYKVQFPPEAWHRLLAENLHDSVRVDIRLKTDSGTRLLHFFWPVQDSVDPYFSCRLIEPSYQTSAHLRTIEYNLRDASLRYLFDNKLSGGSCENCHTYAQNDGDYLIYHVRFNNTGTYIVTPEQDIRVNLKSERFAQGGVYPTWHPNKNIIAFGTASAYPFVHSKDIVRRTEVFDSFGDIILYDVARNYIFSDERLVRADREETFPYWSWDGKWLYICQSQNPDREMEEDDVDFSKKIKYSLIRIAFDENTNRFGHIDTVINASIVNQTVSFPRLSPNGRFLVVCLSDHGTFPIRHPESDLYIMDLGGEKSSLTGFDTVAGFLYPVKKMENVNSSFTESYHNFSSNGKWLMFSSKREDNLYSRPYFSYIDANGVSHKPFLLPQKDPAMYLSFLQSFNVPEFSSKPIRVSAEKAKEYMQLPQKTPDSIVILK